MMPRRSTLARSAEDAGATGAAFREDRRSPKGVSSSIVEKGSGESGAPRFRKGNRDARPPSFKREATPPTPSLIESKAFLAEAMLL